jgi:hypothetical protein
VAGAGAAGSGAGALVSGAGAWAVVSAGGGVGGAFFLHPETAATPIVAKVKRTKKGLRFKVFIKFRSNRALQGFVPRFVSDRQTEYQRFNDIIAT